MSTAHQTQYTRSSGPFAQLLALHGQAVTIGGVSGYTAIVTEGDDVDERGNVLRAAELRGADADLPAIAEKTEIVDASGTTWMATGPGRVRGGTRIVTLHAWTHARSGGFG